MDPHPNARSCSSRGAPSCEAVSSEPSMNLLIHSTTGTRLELSLPSEETVEGLKRRLSQRLRVPKDRLALLHRETRLSSGKLKDCGISDGSKLTLVPTVEAGLMSQASRPEQSVMQALESLTETQVSDFLSGRSPLTLALRVGDHMMFVQLQLAAQQTGGHAHHQQQQQQHPEHPEHRHLLSQAGVPLVDPAVRGSSPKAAHCLHPAAPCAAPAPCPQTAGSSTSSAHSATTPAPGSTLPRLRKPGAVIESFVNHAPGVFSGTFSGTLHPTCQDSSGRPRRDISTVLQILSDLLRATRHYQGVPPSLAQLRCPMPSPPPSPPASPGSAPPGTPPAARPAHLYPLVQCQSQIRVCKPASDRLRQTENRATRCKMERLQLLMQQRHVRRKARRDSRAPYPWVPSSTARKTGRSNSNSSASSDGSLDLDFEDALWKPDVKAELSSEFVMA